MWIKIFILSLLVAFQCRAATHVCSSLDYSVVNATNGLAAVVDGDTIILPAGSVAWDSELVVTKALTFQGSGTNATFIADNVPAGNSAVFKVTLKANLTTTIRDLTITGGARSSDNNNGVIYIIGSNEDGRRAVVRQCNFTNINNRACILVSGAYGVDSGNVYHLDDGNDTFAVAIYGQDDGDADWAADTDFGTGNFWFSETFTYTNSTMYDAFDSYSGARWVARYGNLYRGRFAAHGTDSTPNSRGTRAIEVYNNFILGDGSTSELLALRSGVARVHNNIITNWNGTAIWGLHAFRSSDGMAVFIPWSGANGTNAWDVADGGSPFATNSASTGGSLTMTKVGAGWSVDQWAGYTLWNLTSNKCAEIVSNTGDTITFKAGKGYSYGDMAFASGNHYVINKVTSILDQPGHGKGSLISTGGNPTNPSAQIELNYQWDNLASGVATTWTEAYATIIPGIHYTNDTVAYSTYTYPHPLVSLVTGITRNKLRGIRLRP